MSVCPKPHFEYKAGKTYEQGTEAVKLYLPATEGFINYNIVHSVSPKINCDTWRLGPAYLCDGSFLPTRALTREGAEWEMALKIQGRPDFIGGYAHGDEVYEKMVLSVDGEIVELVPTPEPIVYETLSLEIWSTGYDPLDSCTEVFKHYKKIEADGERITLTQRVSWLGDYTLGTSYMAMMAPLKEWTDSYYTNVDIVKKPVELGSDIIGYSDMDTLYQCGNAGFTFGIKLCSYPLGEDGKKVFQIRDNGGIPYNKMYAPVLCKTQAKKHDEWNTVTVYRIKNS